jgi:transposase
MDPDRDAKKELRKSMEWIQSFMEMSSIEIQKLLYYKWKSMNIPISTSTISLLTQRFSTTATGKDKKFLYVYDLNSRFVFDREWFLEVQLHSKTGKHIEPRIRIPVHRTEVPYYSDIQDMVGYGTTITEEADKWFAYVQIPVDSHEDEWKEKIVGVDFNFRKWVAAMSDERPLIFNVKKYTDRIDQIHKQISRKQSVMRDEITANKINIIEREIKELYSLRDFVVKEAHGNFISEIKKRFGFCTLAVEEVSTMYRMGGHDKGMTNNWLYKKTALSQFQLRAMSHGLDVVEITLLHFSGMP